MFCAFFLLCWVDTFISDMKFSDKSSTKCLFYFLVRVLNYFGCMLQVQTAMLHGGMEGVVGCVLCVSTKQPTLFCLLAFC